MLKKLRKRRPKLLVNLKKIKEQWLKRNLTQANIPKIVKTGFSLKEMLARILTHINSRELTE